MHLPPPPELTTLNAPPSWHNRAGRTDRSACTSIRASDVLPCSRGSRPEGADRRAKRNASSSRRSAVTRRRTHGQRSTTTFLLHARHLARLHDRHIPDQLAGDFRTTKSNAMRDARTPRRNRSHNRLHDRDTAVNPNKGACRSKFLGLWEDWSQRLAMVRRKSKRAPVAPAQFICPACDRRVRNLYLPLCTRPEAADADAAELWLNAVDAHFRALRQPMPADVMKTRADLITRYAPLFRTERQLRCRHCWNIRYGESTKRSA